MLENLPRRGDFGHQPLVGFFRPEPDQHLLHKAYFGLVLEGTYFYGIMAADDGESYAFIRKAVTYTTRDISIMAADETGLRVHPASAQGAKG
ncbi:MAG: hypothetical protein M3Y83_05110, partial [Actinomycetota bacterium]|nr:hypothetical protein [Actinomycetota bacterium]